MLRARRKLASLVVLAGSNGLLQRLAMERVRKKCLRNKKAFVVGEVFSQSSLTA